MKKKLAIVGASFGQRSLYLKAKELGIETHCFAWDEGAVCKDLADYFYPISVLDKEQILTECKKIQIDGITSVASDICVPTVCFVAEKMGLIGNRYEDSLIMCNKFSARKIYQKNGVSSPRFALARENIDLTDFRYPIIVKPIDRGSTIGVIKVEKEEDLKNAILRAQEDSFCKEAIIEEFINGFEVSVDAITYNGKHHILAIKERELAKGVNCDVKIAGHCPTDLPSDIQDKIKNETKKALDAINFNYGASNTEFRITKDGEAFILEVNPRMPGSYSDILMELYNGYDYLKGVIEIALRKFENPVFKEYKYCGVYFLTKQTQWVREVIENRDKDPDIVLAEMSDSEISELHFIGDRIGFFIYQSNQKRRWPQP